MKIPFVVSLTPEQECPNVPLNSLIVLNLDDSVQEVDNDFLEVFHSSTIQDFKQWPKVDFTAPILVKGKTNFCRKSKTLEFTPQHLLPLNVTITCKLNFNKCKVSNSLDLMEKERIFTYQFSTEKSLGAPIRFYLRLKSQRKIISSDWKLLPFSRDSEQLLSTLKTKIAAKFDLNPFALNISIFSQGNSESLFSTSSKQEFEINNNNPNKLLLIKPLFIQTDRDVYLLKNDEYLEVEETDDNYPDVIEDPSLPKLSYEDYVKQHYAPHWAGYYVIGCSKDSEQDVQRLIDALFSWKEVQPFL